MRAKEQSGGGRRQSKQARGHPGHLVFHRVEGLVGSKFGFHVRGELGPINIGKQTLLLFSVAHKPESGFKFKYGRQYYERQY